jgi:hypothetical protein
LKTGGQENWGSNLENWGSNLQKTGGQTFKIQLSKKKMKMGTLGQREIIADRRYGKV